MFINKKPVLEFKDLRYSDVSPCLEIMRENYSIIKKGKEIANGFWSDLFVKDFTSTIEQDNRFYRTKGRAGWLDNGLVCFGFYQESFIATSIYELSWINVLKKLQGNHIGKYLILDLEKQIALDETNSETDFSILFQTDKPIFYEKLGYKTIYKIGEDDLMIKSFNMEDCIRLFAPPHGVEMKMRHTH